MAWSQVLHVVCEVGMRAQLAAFPDPGPFSLLLSLSFQQPRAALLGPGVLLPRAAVAAATTQVLSGVKNATREVVAEQAIRGSVLRNSLESLAAGRNSSFNTESKQWTNYCNARRGLAQASAAGAGGGKSGACGPELGRGTESR